MAKDKDYRWMIHTSRWRRLRRSKLTASPLCERCRQEGRIAAATVVHHIMPVEDASCVREKETRMFDYHNLMSLCHECHVAIHTEMGRGGRLHARRKAKAWLEDFRKKFS